MKPIKVGDLKEKQAHSNFGHFVGFLKYPLVWMPPLGRGRFYPADCAAMYFVFVSIELSCDQLVTFTDETSDGNGFQLQTICEIPWCQGGRWDAKHRDRDLLGKTLWAALHLLMSKRISISISISFTVIISISICVSDRDLNIVLRKTMLLLWAVTSVDEYKYRYTYMYKFQYQYNYKYICVSDVKSMQNTKI